MAPVSKAIHVGYMRSLCKKEWRTGWQMILSAVRHGPSGESTIAFMQAESRKLVHAAVTKPSQLSIANQGALQFRKLWRSIVGRDIVVWVDNSWDAQFWANPVKPNVCLHVNAIAVLHTTPLPLFLGHPSLHDLVDRVDTVAMALVQRHIEMLKVCSDMCNAPISRRTICAPLDIAGRLVDNNSFGSHWAYMSPVQVRTKSSWIRSICYAVPDSIVRTRWHCSFIATSTTGCSNFCTPEQPLAGIFHSGCGVSR